ncbi:hypothetical protein EYZ11_000340 [Aspergillus tanneri]|uniref:Methyltransferase type 11 domain-containing protein n=1 Tax=Aspergillus tanneri TaxID=1220188 RepID=A0A4S3JX99_9EURO|nr:hypothetical protein EYZ11_000340 [Aspergillus tanneri]
MDEHQPQADSIITPEADDDLHSDWEEYESGYVNGCKFDCVFDVEYPELSVDTRCGSHAPVCAGTDGKNPRMVGDIMHTTKGNMSSPMMNESKSDLTCSFPEAIVIGTDLSPIQPSWVPPNCIFEIDDFELDWNFSQPFDFIHARAIEGSVKDFPRLFSQAYEFLRPGGWFEVVDFTAGVFSDDESSQKSTSLLEWRDRLTEASEMFGKPLGVSPNYREWMIQAGFKNVREKIFKVPFSPWAKNPKLKELGRYQQENMLEALDAYSLALLYGQKGDL